MVTATPEKNREYVSRSRAKASRQNADLLHTFGEQLAAGPKDPERRASCENDVVKFWQTYLPYQFPAPFAPHHIEMARELEFCIREQAWHCHSDSRGGGKSTRSRGALLWGVLYGHIKYAVIVTATGRSNRRTRNAILKELRTNPKLIEDFPEACLPIIHAKGDGLRARNQILGEEERPSWLELTQDKIALANTQLDYSRCDQGIIEFTSMQGDVRGRFHTTPDGHTVRPDFSFVDDPATKKSAKSAQSSREQVDTIEGDIGYLGGPGARVGMLVLVTCMREGDTADILLGDNEFRPIRNALVTSMPTNMDWWDRYAEKRREWQSQKMTPQELTEHCNDLYESERDIADEGAVVSWADLPIKSGELSVLQYAMHQRIKSRETFETELQNNPRASVEDSDGVKRLRSSEVQQRTNGIDRGLVPDSSSKLIGHIDISKDALWWSVLSFESQFTGHLVTNGVWPDQGSRYVGKDSIAVTLLDKYGGTEASAIQAGLSELSDMICGKEWQTESSDVVSLDLCGVDANWQKHKTLVYDICRRSKYKAILIPTHGKGTTAQRPHLWAPTTNAKPGEQRGEQCRLQRWDHQRVLQVNTNHWKTFAYERMIADVGTQGALTLWGTVEDQHRHAMFADQCSAERGVEVSTERSTIDAWELVVGQTDEHFFDNVYNCCAMASLLGCSLVESQKEPTKPKLSWAQMRARHRK